MGVAPTAASDSDALLPGNVRGLQDYDALFRLLAADLLHVVCRQRCTCAELVASGGVGKVSKHREQIFDCAARWRGVC